MEPVLINDQQFFSLGSNVDEIRRLRLGRLVRLVAVETDGKVTVLSAAINSRHPDAQPGDGNDDGSAIATLCEHHARKHPRATFAVRFVR